MVINTQGISYDEIPYGDFRAEIMRYGDCSICAFPGVGVVYSGRAEHLPFHIHVFSPNGQFRINCETLREMNEKKVPKNIIDFLRANKKEIVKKTQEVFERGRFS